MILSKIPETKWRCWKSGLRLIVYLFNKTVLLYKNIIRTKCTGFNPKLNLCNTGFNKKVKLLNQKYYKQNKLLCEKNKTEKSIIN